MPSGQQWLTRLFPDLDGWQVEAVEDGMSGAAVLALSREGFPAQYVKAVRGKPLATSILNEAERTRWLYAAGIRVPRILASEVAAGYAAIRMTALEGVSPYAHPWPPQRIAAAIGSALARLHAIDAATCPFDMCLANRLAEARAAVAAGSVEPEEFAVENIGVSPEALLARLLARIPASADVVVTHGDATLANIVIDEDGAVGFIDCGRSGTADRYQDLALMLRDIRDEWGAAAEAALLAAYGLAAPDRAKLAFYELLEEFS